MAEVKVANKVSAKPNELRVAIDLDVVKEAQRVIKEAESRAVTLRLLGGVAFALRTESSSLPGLKRQYKDMDFAALSRERKEVLELFRSLGYAPRGMFNALYGTERLIFDDLVNKRRVDVFLDQLRMCHDLDFKDRLKLSPTTLPLADLLLTKLQVVEITEKEYKDVIALLKDKKLSKRDSNPDKINAKYIARLCANDWPLCNTVKRSLDRVEEALTAYLPGPEERSAVKLKLDELRAAIEAEPKSMRWKLRAQVGEKVRWYQLPESDADVFDLLARQARGS